MNAVLFRLDAMFDGAYTRGRSAYAALMAGFFTTAFILTGMAAIVGLPGSVWEALLGGSAGLSAFIGARGLMMHYNRANPEDYRAPLRERMGLERGKTLGAIAGGWLLVLVVLGAQGTQHPAIGALTILVGLTLVTLATRTPEEKAAIAAQADDDTVVWSSSDEGYLEDESYDEYEYEYEDEDDPYDDSADRGDDSSGATAR